MEPSKSVHIALQAIFGIGKTKATKICELIGLSQSVRINQLKRLHVEKIRHALRRYYRTASDLERLIQNDRKVFIKIGCYRGFRHNSRLPCRGQRTHTNAKTCRRVTPARGGPYSKTTPVKRGAAKATLGKGGVAKKKK